MRRRYKLDNHRHYTLGDSYTYIRDFAAVLCKCHHFGKEDARTRDNVDEDYQDKLRFLAEGTGSGATSVFLCLTRKFLKTTYS